MKQTCKQCGKTFELTPSEIEFYKSKNLTLPKRCKECREANKNSKSNKNNSNSSDMSKAAQKNNESSRNSSSGKTTSKIQYQSPSSNQNSPKKNNNIVKLLAALVMAVIVAVGSYLGISSNGSSKQTEAESITASVSSGSEESAEGSKDDAKAAADSTADTVSYTFRNSNLLNQHYQKHGIEMGFDSAEDYEKAASAVVNNPDALHKTEAEDGDDVYYVEDTNEFVIVSSDGYIRTYFNPSDGIDYYNRQ